MSEQEAEYRRIRLQAGLNAVLERESQTMQLTEPEIDHFEFAFKKGFDEGYKFARTFVSEADK